MKKVLRPVALPPITSNQNINSISNITAVIFRNGGNATVNLWNGAYTLDSKETLSFNVTEDSGALILEDIPVSFNTGTGAVKLLQIIIIKPDNC